ncbi:MAG: methyltransferase domain-containing protein [Parvibaculum sp.]
MYPDVLELWKFYDRPLGRVARELIRAQIRGIWPNVRGMNVAGFGYATPYLDAFLGEATRTIALMPAEQGVMVWPEEGQVLSTLAVETRFPLADESFDRILLVHSVENSEALRGLLRQVWQVLAPGGRVIVVAPNRHGFWSRRDKTPFGTGRPFTRLQLGELLRGAMFTPTVWRSTLFVPPFGVKALMRSVGFWERLGGLGGQRFAGVILVEAAKQVYALPPAEPKRASRARLLAPIRVLPSANAKVSRLDAGSVSSPKTKD